MVYFYASSVPNWVTGKPTVPTLSRPLFKFVRRVQDEEKCVWFHPGWWTFSSLVSSGALQNCSSRILAGYLFVQFSTHHRYLFVHHVFWMIGHLFIWIWRTSQNSRNIYIPSTSYKITGEEKHGMDTQEGDEDGVNIFQSKSFYTSSHSL